MERTRINRTPTAILCSDLHIREDTPTCWVGDFQLEQWNALQFIKDLQIKYDCPVVCAGDFFHTWKASPWLLSKTIDHLPSEFYTILGQHDLQNHALPLVDKCGVYTLEKAGKLKILPWVHWGQTPEVCKNYKGSIDLGTSNILVWHHLTYQQKPFPGAEGGMAAGILRKYPQYDLILTGDNHQAFVEEYQGRLLVNPGSMTRQTADQADFRPRVYLWYAETNTVTPVYLPTQENAISRKHLDQKKERDERIEAFISKLDGDWEAEMSFEDNLERFFETNPTRGSIKEIIYKAIEI